MDFSRPQPLSPHAPSPAGAGASDPLVGTVLAGRYRIVDKLGEGAMGAVYLGEHLQIGRCDAIKVLRGPLTADPEAIARFLRGARNVSQIRHPNVCTIYDFSHTADGLQFLAMEFIAGETLQDLLAREGVLPVARAVAIAKQVADALQAAHDAGIVHRDLKPGNIMISRHRNGADQVKVVDFDIAKGAGEGQTAEVTRLGFAIGTPEYMSPEQLMAEPLDGRSDVYSLALVLARMLTGRLPFRAAATHELMIERLTQKALRLDEVSPERSFPPALQAAIERALQGKASDRTASAAAFGEEVALAVGLAPSWNGPPTNPNLQPPTGPNAASQLPATRETAAPAQPLAGIQGRTLTIGSAAIVAAVAGGLMLTFFRTGPSDVPPGPLQPPEVRSAPAAPSGATALNGGSSSTPADGAAATPEPEVTPLSETGTGPMPETSTRPPVKRPTTSGPAALPAAAAPRPEEVKAFLDGLMDRLVDEPSARRDIRSQAEAVWGRPGMSDEHRAYAASIISTTYLDDGDGESCERWARRADRLRPTDGTRRAIAACSGVDGE
jgi:serine/threonine protein kinase